MDIADSLNVDTNLTYCPVTLNVSQALNITNVSDHELVFKVKTNKKNFISMNPCNGFIKPFSALSIPVKIVENVPENVSIKLEVDWALVTPEMKEKNDIKMATVNEKDIHKKVFPIIRKEEANAEPHHESAAHNLPKPSKDIISEIKKSEEEKKITPFEYEKKPEETQKAESPKKKIEILHQNDEKISSPMKEKSEKEEEISDDVLQYRSANNMLASLSLPNKSLEIVSEEDEEDHEKELEHIKNQEVEELRRIDEIKSKFRKLNQEIKSTEIIDPKLLMLAIIGSFLFGAFIQYLIF